MVSDRHDNDHSSSFVRHFQYCDFQNKQERNNLKISFDIDKTKANLSCDQQVVSLRNDKIPKEIKLRIYFDTKSTKYEIQI